MNTKIYAGHLDADTTESQLMDLFSTYGNVADVNIAVEGVDHKARRFGCVIMVTSEGAQAAIQALNGRTLGTATLTVREWWSNPGANLPNGRSPLRSASKLY